MMSLLSRALRPRRLRKSEAFQRSGMERRAFPRIRTRNLVRYFCETGGKELTNLYDISEGGLRLRMTGPVMKGSAVEVSINLKEMNTKVSGLGEVVWISEPSRPHQGFYQAGVRFTEIREENRKIIRQFVIQKRALLDRRA